MVSKRKSTFNNGLQIAKEAKTVDFSSIHIASPEQIIKPVELANVKKTIYFKPSEVERFERIIGKKHFSGEVRKCVLRYIDNIEKENINDT